MLRAIMKQAMALASGSSGIGSSMGEEGVVCGGGGGALASGSMDEKGVWRRVSVTCVVRRVCVCV